MRILKNINYSINDVTNKLTLSIIVIIQLTVSIVFLYNGLVSTSNNLKNINKIKNAFQIGSIHRLDSLDELDNLSNVKMLEEDFPDRLNKFENFLQKSEDFICIRFNNNSIQIEKFEECDSFENNNLASEVKNNKSFINVKALSGDRKYYENFKFSIMEGRAFNERDFDNNDIVPVILGYNYTEIYKVGDTITALNPISHKEIDLKIVGFLEEGCYFFQKTLSPMGVSNTDNYILYPLADVPNDITKDNTEERLSRFFDTMLISNCDDEYLTKIIKEKSNDLKLFNIEVSNGQELLNRYTDMSKNQRNYSILIFCIIILFTAINTITSMVNYISQKKKEFAINIMCGATIDDLVQRILSQNSIIMGMSFCLMIPINKIINKNSGNEWFDLKILIITGFICIVLVVLMSLIPIIKLNTIKINTIIKED